MRSRLDAPMTLRAALVFNLVPMAVFTLVIFAVTGGVLAAVDLVSADIGEKLAAGTLVASDIADIANTFRTVWLASLAGFLAFAGGTVATSRWVHRTVERRVETLAELAMRAASGEPLEPLPRRCDSGPLGRLTSAIFEAGQMARERNERIRERTEQIELDASLQRALEQCDSETDIMELVGRALEKVKPGADVRIKLADEPLAPLRIVFESDDNPVPGCPVEHVDECTALKSRDSVAFRSSEQLDACPALRRRTSGPCSSTCTPVNVLGRAIGVVNVVDDEDDGITPRQQVLLQTIASRAGARLSLLRKGRG